MIGFRQLASAQPIGLGCRRLLTKAALIPLIKRIHPDLYLKYGDEVVETNKTFVQNLYELSDFLRGIESKALGRGLNPLRASYCLDFYLKNRDAEEIVETKVEIIPDNALCEHSLLINKKLDSAVVDLKTQIGDVYAKAGLLSPFGKRQRFGKIPGDAEEEVDLADIDRIVYERYMAKKRNTHQTGPFSKAVNRLEQDADDFIRSGGVLFQGMSPPDEAKALNRVRKFLVEYGTVLSVGSSSRWNSIHLVIADTNESQGNLDSYTIRSVGKSRKAVVIELPKISGTIGCSRCLPRQLYRPKRVKRVKCRKCLFIIMRIVIKCSFKRP